MCVCVFSPFLSCPGIALSKTEQVAVLFEERKIGLVVLLDFFFYVVSVNCMLESDLCVCGHVCPCESTCPFCHMYTFLAMGVFLYMKGIFTFVIFIRV